jgi:hypothetical protein
MKNDVLRKTLVVAIIILFLGASITITQNIFVKTAESKPVSIFKDNFNGNIKCSKKWTVMYYMCGDSNMDIYISPLLEKLSDIGSSENLNIVALKDNLGKNNSNLFYIDEAGNLIDLNYIYDWPDEVDMSNLDVLELFCTQMMENYSADHYALITYSSAGTGWQQFCLLDKDKTGGKISTPKFAYSLKNITNEVNHKIDVLFVSCAMNTIELAYEIFPYVDYIVGTQDCFMEKSIVPRFSESVWDLKNDSDMNPEEFCSMAPYRFDPKPFYYNEAYNKELPLLLKILNKLPFKGLHTVIHYPSSSVINLSRINELAKKLDNLSLNLIENLKDIKLKEGIRRARSETQEYNKCIPKYLFLYNISIKYPLNIFAYDCVVDLYNFIEILRYYVDNDIIKNQCNSILEFYKEVIPKIKKISYDNSNGLSIYFPKNRHMYNKYIFNGKIPCPYEDLQFSKYTSWDDFLQAYLKI